MLTPPRMRNSSGNVPISCESRDEMVITSWSSHECCARGYEVISLFIQASERHAARSTDGRTSLQCPTVLFGISTCGTGCAKGLNTGKILTHANGIKIPDVLRCTACSSSGAMQEEGATKCSSCQLRQKRRSITLFCWEYRVDQGVPQGLLSSTDYVRAPCGIRPNHHDRKGRENNSCSGADQ